jgi:hypothetical protein
MTPGVGAHDQEAPPSLAQLGLKAGPDIEAEKFSDRILLFADARQEYDCQTLLAKVRITRARESRAIQVIERAALNDMTESARLEGLLSRVTPGQICQVVGGVCTII